MFPSWKQQEPVKNKLCSWSKSIIISALFLRKSASSTKERSIRLKLKLTVKIAHHFSSKIFNFQQNSLHKNRRRWLDLWIASEISSLQSLYLINLKNIRRQMSLTYRNRSLKNVWCRPSTRKYSKILQLKWTTSRCLTSKKNRKT